MILLKIAFRNVKKNRKNSIFIGITIFIASLLFFISNFSVNGVEDQVINGYLKLQTGHVAIEHRDMEEVDKGDKSKYITNMKTFDAEEKEENEKSVAYMNEYLEQKKDQIQEICPVIKKGVQITTKDNTDSLVLYGITDSEAEYLMEDKAIKLKSGTFLSEEENTICISEEKLETNNLNLNDEISFTVVGLSGEQKELTYKITGVYEDMAGYDNLYGFLPFERAQEIFDYEYFDYMKIFLKDPETSEEFAKDATIFFKNKDANLMAEDYMSASTFYTSNPAVVRGLFNGFIVIFLFTICIGFLSTIKMNLLTRYKEFGTFRAIGYSKFKLYLIIFYEVLFLSIIALSASFAVSVLIVALIGMSGKGIYVGNGAVTYALGGEQFYPYVRPDNVILGFGLIIVFSVFSTLSPGGKLVNLNIIDLLAERYKKVSFFKLKQK